MAMKKLPDVPFFETSVKCYLYGDAALNYAAAVDAAACRYDVDVIFIAPLTEIRRVKERTERLLVFAPHMDPLRPGRGMADILPEAILEAGAAGVLLNHCEKPLTLSVLEKTIARANELGLVTFVCANSVAEAKAVAQLAPDILNPEPAELIGGDKPSDMGFVKATLAAVRTVAPGTLVEQAAGVRTGRQVYDFLMAGNDGAGAASGILKAPDPLATLDDMIRHVRKAKDDLARIRTGDNAHENR